jgi:F-type H+-transporting ATPase subunit b
MRGRRLLAAAVAWAVFVAVPALVLAEEGGGHGGGHGHAEHHAPGIDTLLFPVINFAIFVVILVRFVLPAVRTYLPERRAAVVKTTEEATSALAAAEQRVKTARDRLARIDGESAAVRDDLVGAATQQAERLRTAAQATGERRLADAALLAQSERRRALDEVRAETAALAARLAEDRIRGALGPDDQRAFVQQFLKDAAGR